jgi:hypothetical protein
MIDLAGLRNGYVCHLWALALLTIFHHMQGGMLGITGSSNISIFPMRNHLGCFRTIVLPAELSAAAIIASFYVPLMEDTNRYDSIVRRLSYGTTSVLVSGD